MKIREVSSSIAYLETTDAMLKCNCAANAIGVTLSVSKSYPGEVNIKKVDSSANAVTITPASGETIDGSESITLTIENEKKTLIPVDGGWTEVDNINDLPTAAVDLTSAQTLTNKTLTSPKINEDVAVTATATELNLIDGSIAGTAVASKALALGANKNVDVLAVADLKLGAGAGTSVTSTAAQLNKAGTKAATVSRLYNLGAPDLADDDLIVTTTNMIVGTYTVAASPDIPRNITVTVTAGATADTMGTITIDGTNYLDAVISEVITPAAGSTVAGVKAFKTVTAVTGAGWVIDAVEGTNDTIVVGTGNEIGLPIALTATTQIPLAILGTTITAHNPTVTTTVENATIDMSAGTYDGTKSAIVFIVD